MKAVCSYCKKHISKSPATLNVYKNAFCDRTCYHAYQREVWKYPRPQKENNSFFHRLKQRFGGASNENTKNQKVQTKGIQRPINNTKTTNPTDENH
jgi:hypothetical protein